MLLIQDQWLVWISRPEPLSIGTGCTHLERVISSSFFDFALAMMVVFRLEVGRNEKGWSVAFSPSNQVILIRFYGIMGIEGRSFPIFRSLLLSMPPAFIEIEALRTQWNPSRMC